MTSDTLLTMTPYTHDAAMSKEQSDALFLDRLSHQIARIREDQSSVKDELRGLRDAMQKMSEAVARLALVEERQAAASQAIERVMATVDRIDQRVRALEVAEPAQRKAAEWVERAIWGAAMVAVMFVAYKVGLVQ